MRSYLRLHLLRLARHPIGRSALLAALLVPAAALLGLHAIGTIASNQALTSGEVARGTPAFLGLLVAIGATGWIPASLLHDERAERRVSVLRAAGIDGLRAGLAALAVALASGCALSAAAFVTPAIQALARMELAGLAMQLVAAIFAALALGALGLCVEVIAGRAGWAVVNACATFLLAGIVASPQGDAALGGGVVAGLGLLALASCVLALATLHLSARLRRLRFDAWS